MKEYAQAPHGDVSAEQPNIIEVDGLVKRYGTFTAVNGIQFQVKRGEIFGLLGPNGAGKTTTMEMIEGLRQPDEGVARVAGYDTRTQLSKVKEVIGVQLQSTSLFDLLTVKEITAMYASFYHVPTLPILPLLDSVTLSEKLNDRVKNLSGGQKQRLAIALALVNDPQVVFLDEPTTGLDPQARRTLWDIILKLRDQGKTIIISTHYMDEAELLSDRICLMDRGSIVALDTPRNLIRSLESESAIEFRVPALDTMPEERRSELLDSMQGIEGVRQAEFRKDSYVLYTDQLQSALTGLVALTERDGIQFTDLLTRTATLEDVFIHMTGRSLRES
ncbi:ABC transporter ATP-binding protein [Paenibacillus oenotherae]|uniref:ABC transporter ATP-binding protein n=1 Tax=Paenibacillus oenotherae TaxID=1435645 RepID=A0ABS7D9F3_9BACL|nr:ABC transporter ATP-binding protein [Paenibacillus oenotherae]MBW7476579.1 ABC transporter ATP-binding protein [Paenibacillus oenotherae]